ncbi:MAG: hypothetical protein A3F67_11565 [Verrucomicrobia bacterium RIFCSPHIGHO2_12_FULL_41_10]|nr:MAG: hypothetical protein A3F67_11565 [Verrucomicrobia bacterium RIFCSPHIGHO2_12_FULL_41_10]HLB33394.1 hypothetical protein [Chthoniobacterales bacterium]
MHGMHTTSPQPDHLIHNLPSNSTEAAKGCVATVLEASSSSCTLNFCAPSTPCPSSASASLEAGSQILLPKERRLERPHKNLNILFQSPRSGDWTVIW